ncbi:MAG: HAD family hydrolase [Verrucomicrobia bacterium]|nr:HAD family hydrolase [Verrucomicrobiota bacterium]
MRRTRKARDAEPKRAVFLDRDGTLVHETHYLHRVEDVRFVARAATALRRLRRAGFLLFIITNQSGVGRGFYTLEDVQRVNRYLLGVLGKYGAEVDGIYVCPHHPEDRCNCRKPSPKFLFDAAAQFDLRLADSFMVGDHISDIEAGRRAGARTVMVRTGHGEENLREAGGRPPADHVARDLSAAVTWILKQKRESQ